RIGHAAEVEEGVLRDSAGKGLGVAEAQVNGATIRGECEALQAPPPGLLELAAVDKTLLARLGLEPNCGAVVGVQRPQRLQNPSLLTPSRVGGTVGKGSAWFNAKWRGSLVRGGTGKARGSDSGDIRGRCEMATYRALLVGNSTFPEDPHNLPELHGPVN